MTEIFRGGTTNNLATEFTEKVKFRNFLLDTGYDFLDTLYSKSLYGFINRNYEVIAPTPDVTIFGDYAEGVEGLTFVVNQFNNFRDHYLLKASQGNFEVPTLIENLVPSVSFKDYELSYSGYIENYQSPMVEKVLLSRMTLTFEQFIRFFHQRMFDRDILGQSATKSGFMLSPDANVYNTGLYIDLRQEQGIANDQLKADFIMEDGFKCFMEFANKFGFYIDGNYPWRIALNLDHEYTRTLLMNGRPTPLFDNFYADTFTMKVAYDDYWSIVKLYKEAYVAYNELSGRQTFNNFSRSITRELWLETLLLHKFNELGLMKTEDKTNLFKETLQKTLDISIRYGLLSTSGPIGYIATFCAEQLKNKILGQP